MRLVLNCKNWGLRSFSVQFSSSVVFSSLWPHELQHTRPPCPSPTPVVYPNPSSTRAHQVGDSIHPSPPLLFPSPPSPNPSQHQGFFPMSLLFTWCGQSTGASASVSVLPLNIQDWSSLGWTGWISLQSKGLSRVFSNTTVQKHSAFFIVQLSHPYMTTGKTIVLRSF